MNNYQSLSDTIQSYKKYMHGNKRRSISTVTAYECDIKVFCKYLDKKGIELLNVTPLVASDYMLESMETKKYTTVLRHWNALTSFYSFLKKIPKLVSDDPFKDVMPEQSKAEKNEEEEKKDVLTQEELNLLLKTIRMDIVASETTGDPVRDYAIVKIMMNTGCRANEVCKLTLDDIDFDDMMITFRKTKNGKTMERNVKADTIKAISSYIKNKDLTDDKCDTIFTTRFGTPIETRTINKMIDKYIEKAGIVGKHITSHCFRHSYATELYKATGDINIVKDSLNHSSVDTTMRYVRGNVNHKVKTTFSL
ncbi:MAG: tyrosine-type recombinase/integrase [Peptostreptococcaceae bacterium]